MFNTISVRWICINSHQLYAPITKRGIDWTSMPWFEVLAEDRFHLDIVVGDIGDINQPQCHKCTKWQKLLWEKREERHLWHCGWPMSPMSPTTMSPKYYPSSACIHYRYGKFWWWYVSRSNERCSNS